MKYSVNVYNLFREMVYRIANCLILRSIYASRKVCIIIAYKESDYCNNIINTNIYNIYNDNQILCYNII